MLGGSSVENERFSQQLRLHDTSLGSPGGTGRPATDSRRSRSAAVHANASSTKALVSVALNSAGTMRLKSWPSSFCCAIRVSQRPSSLPARRIRASSPAAVAAWAQLRL
jgi:hypothetical protein